MPKSKNIKPPYISHAEFRGKVRALNELGKDAAQDTYQTAEVLTYLGVDMHWPSYSSLNEKKEFEKTILAAVERVDWSLYMENFVYIPSNLYPYIEHCMYRGDSFVDEIRSTRFARLCAVACALVADVHPDRRSNLHSRIEAWSGLDIDEHAPTMLGALFSGWSRHDAAVLLGNYGAMLSALDPLSSRSASVLSSLLQQMEGHQAEASQSIDFLFDSSQ